MKNGTWEPGKIVQIGLENPEAVSLVLAPEVSQEVRDLVDDLREKIISDEIEVSVEYDGPELQP